MTAPPVNVSRETMMRLTQFHDLVQKWSPKINLVSKSSMKTLWDRHIWDSAQVVPLAQPGAGWVDLGSGGGFPGIVAAIFAKEEAPDRRITLIESDIRKSTFLRTVIRDLKLNAAVIVGRIETVDPQGADVLTARALAELPLLLDLAQIHLKSGGQALFLKGESWQKEVEAARESWSFDLVAHKSKTNPNAAILELREIERA